MSVMLVKFIITLHHCKAYKTLLEIMKLIISTHQLLNKLKPRERIRAGAGVCYTSLFVLISFYYSRSMFIKLISSLNLN